MENIWYFFWFNVFSIIVLIIASIILFIKKEKYYIITEIIFFLFLLYVLEDSVRFIKDITNQETTEIIAVYERNVRGSGYPGARILVFQDGGKTYKIMSPRITKIHMKMEVGKTYKIEYFDNTEIIKNYILIE